MVDSLWSIYCTYCTSPQREVGTVSLSAIHLPLSRKTCGACFYPFCHISIVSDHIQHWQQDLSFGWHVLEVVLYILSDLHHAMTAHKVYPYTCEIDVSFPTAASAKRTRDVLCVDKELGDRVVKTIIVLPTDPMTMRMWVNPLQFWDLSFRNSWKHADRSWRQKRKC